jgi:hypothetical protein
MVNFDTKLKNDTNSTSSPDLLDTPLERSKIFQIWSSMMMEGVLEVGGSEEASELPLCGLLIRAFTRFAIIIKDLIKTTFRN